MKLGLKRKDVYRQVVDLIEHPSPCRLQPQRLAETWYGIKGLTDVVGASLLAAFGGFVSAEVGSHSYPTLHERALGPIVAAWLLVQALVCLPRLQNRPLMAAMVWLNIGIVTGSWAVWLSNGQNGAWGGALWSGLVASAFAVGMWFRLSRINHNHGGGAQFMQKAA